MATVSVVGAALVRGGRVLAARRSRPAALARAWEFPGGKVEPGEADVDALARECHEELGVTVSVGVRLGQAVDGPIRLTLYGATLRTGRPQPLQDHDELRWLTADTLTDVGWLPIDRTLLPAVTDHLLCHSGTVRFRARLERHGKTATGIVVPDELVRRLQRGERPRVAVTIRGYTFRTTIAPMGGQLVIGVSAENRAAAAVAAGDVLDVDVEPAATGSLPRV